MIVLVIWIPIFGVLVGLTFGPPSPCKKNDSDDFPSGLPECV